MAMQSRLFPSWYTLAPDAVGLLESYPFLEGNHFKNWIIYYNNIHHTPIDYYVYTLYMQMAMQSRLLTSWYPLTPDAVGLMESSPVLEGNYFNNMVCYNI
jgi:hypothetical protein